MPKTSEMRESKFLKKEDVGRGALATISGCVKKNTAMEGADPEHKWCLTFREFDKPLVLNVINTMTIEQITGLDDTDQWIGKVVVLYEDPTVMYAGKITGGIRVRARKDTAPPPPVKELTHDDIPF